MPDKLKVPTIKRGRYKKILWTKQLDKFIIARHAQGYTQADTARLLHMAVTTLCRREKKLGVDRKRDKRTNVWQPTRFDAPYKSVRRPRQIKVKPSPLSPMLRPAYVPPPEPPRRGE